MGEVFALGLSTMPRLLMQRVKLGNNHKELEITGKQRIAVKAATLARCHVGSRFEGKLTRRQEI